MPHCERVGMPLESQIAKTSGSAGSVNVSSAVVTVMVTGPGGRFGLDPERIAGVIVIHMQQQSARARFEPGGQLSIGGVHDRQSRVPKCGFSLL